MTRQIVEGFPRRIFPAETTVYFQTLLAGDFAECDLSGLTLAYVRDDWRREDGSVTSLQQGEASFWQPVSFRRQGKALLFDLLFHGEHEHTLRFSLLSEGQVLKQFFSFYSLQDDLAGLRAYKGNVHSHSSLSDGLQEPGLIPSVMRCAGFDFCALTDHNHYTVLEDSLLSGIECYAGEEASSQPGVNHFLSLGTAFSISSWQNAENADFRARVDHLRRTFPFSELPSHECELAAQCEVLCRKIREGGGLSVFCHPYWFCESRYYSTFEEVDFFLRHGSYDAIELGNYRIPRMAMLNAKLMELGRETGFCKPCIGASDWHARPGQTAEIASTILFAKSPSFEDFADAVRSGRCVAVGGSRDAFPFGSLRLVKYACFLQEHYFQGMHDPLCRKQGEKMLEMQQTGSDQRNEIAALRSKIENLSRQFFAD